MDLGPGPIDRGSLLYRGSSVVGVIGPHEDPVAQAFLDRYPNDFTLVRDRLIEVRGFGQFTESGYGISWGRSFQTAGSPDGWEAASEHFGSAGVMREGADWVVFTDSLGVNPIFYRSVKGSTFFSTHLAPLIAIPGGLTPDWEGWASTTVICSPVGRSTHFREINRLEAASGLMVGSGGKARHLTYMPGWAIAAPGQVTLPDLIDALREAMPLVEDEGPPAITLSGGWDSRFLAVLAAEVYGKPLSAWTTGQDDGRDLDLVYAPPVAEALGFTHVFVPQPEGGWGALATDTRERVEYQTWLHTWYLPLARAMKGQVTDILDGLAGDRILQDKFSKPEDFRTSSWGRSRNVFSRLGGDPMRFDSYLTGRAADQLVETARLHYLRVASRFEGHPSKDTIASLLTRAVRAVALAPSQIFGPEIKAWTPFTHPDVLRLAFSVDPRDKLSGEAALAALRLVNRTAADLPSTSQPGRKPPRTLKRLQSSPETVQWMVDRILESEAASSMFKSSVLSEMRSGRFIERTPDFEETRILQAASLLGQWELKYRDRLDWTNPGWGGSSS